MRLGVYSQQVGPIQFLLFVQALSTYFLSKYLTWIQGQNISVINNTFHSIVYILHDVSISPDSLLLKQLHQLKSNTVFKVFLTQTRRELIVFSCMSLLQPHLLVLLPNNCSEKQQILHDTNDHYNITLQILTNGIWPSIDILIPHTLKFCLRSLAQKFKDPFDKTSFLKTSQSLNESKELLSEWWSW